MNFEISNMDEILNQIEELADSSKMRSAMGKACALVERSAKQKAPRGTGELSRSITSKVDVENGEVTGLIFTPVEYAPYVEYGTGLFAEGGNGRKDVPWCYQDDKGEWHSTSGMPPHPYMRPAIDENREQILRILKEGLGND